MSEWMDVKSEGSAPQFLPSDTSGIESGVYLPPAESHVTSDPQSVSLPPDPEHVFSGRPTTAPSERQRTVQACDKCRERKTKCSGEHPVCQRCTTRGLICQYSSREPRTRGPAKARLRNAISSADLRTSPHPRAYSHGPQPPQHLRHYSSQTLSDYRSLRRVSSIPTTLRADESNELSLNPPTFETYPSFAVEEPPLQFQPGDPRTSQLRDMRRVQSHSTLVGSRGGNLRTTLSHPSFRSTHEFPGQMTYGQQWTSQGGTPSPSMPMFEPSYDRLLPPGGRADQNTQLRPSPKVHPWGHRSNDSTGSEPLPSDVNIEYSPASSEEVPEPCQTTFVNYNHYGGADVGLNLPMPSHEDCTPQFLGPSMFVPGDHFSPQGVAIARPSSDSDIHTTSYEQYVFP